jgi:hypothetical protein
MWRRVTGRLELRGCGPRRVCEFGVSFVGGTLDEETRVNGGCDGFGYDVETERYELKRLNGESV